MDEHLLDNELVKFYFKKKYPDNRYQFKTYSVICDMFYNPNNDLFVIEFIDTKMIHTKTLELQVKRNDLYNINIK